MQQLELGILDWIQANLRCGALDVLMPALSWTCNHGEIWIVLAAVLLAVKRYRRQGLAVGGALVTDLVLCNLILKPLVGRVRPFVVHPVELLVPPPTDASFPSGHTAASFAAVFALKASGSPLWKPALAVAVAMWLFVDVSGGGEVERTITDIPITYVGEDDLADRGLMLVDEGTSATVDLTLEAQMILSCVHRIRAALGYGVGSQLVAQVLTGSRDRRVLELGLDRLSTYGLMKGRASESVARQISQLVELGLLRRNMRHGALEPTDRAAGVLFRGEKVLVPTRTAPEVKPAASAEPDFDASLFGRLRRLRTRLAQEQGIPPYLVFTDATLREMAHLAPVNMAEFLQVSGVGKFKAEKYGAAFLEELKK